MRLHDPATIFAGQWKVQLLVGLYGDNKNLNTFTASLHQSCVVYKICLCSYEKMQNFVRFIQDVALFLRHCKFTFHKGGSELPADGMMWKV